MNIVLVNSHYLPDERGGAEKSVRLLAESLHADGHRVTVIRLSTNRDSAAVNDVSVETLPIRNAYLPGVEQEPSGLKRMLWHTRDAWNPLAAKDMTGALAALEPDVVHTNNLAGFSVSIWQAARRLGIRTVHTLRDFYLLCPRSSLMRDGVACGPKRCTACRVLSEPKRLLSAQVSHVVGISRFMLQTHQQHGFFANVSSSVIHNPYSPPPLAMWATRPAGPHPTTLGFMGRIVAEKGVHVLIEAIAKLLPTHPGLRLKIAGEGPTETVQQLRGLAAHLPVEFLGRLTPEQFFPALDLTVVPSIWNEPLGRVVIESMCFGVPVVATPVGGIPELLEHGGGMLSKDLGADALAEAIRAVLSMMAARPGALQAEAKRLAESQFAGSHIAARYLQVFGLDALQPA